MILPKRIDVEMGYLYPRKRITDSKKRIVSDVVAVSNKHYVRTEILRREQQFAVRYLSAKGAYAKRRKKPRHVTIRELAYPPIVADRSAHEFAPGTHSEISVAANHQVVHKQDAMRFISEFHAMIISQRATFNRLILLNDTEKSVITDSARYLQLASRFASQRQGTLPEIATIRLLTETPPQP
jgi:hypothetical protein